MPVHRDKARGCFVYEFDRRINGRRIRAVKVLPKGWTQGQADAYDRTESARLYAEASGVAAPRVTIDQAVLAYLTERASQLRTFDNLKREFLGMESFYTGRLLDELPAVAREYQEHCATHAGPKKKLLTSVTIGRRIAYLRAACRYYWKSRRLPGPDPSHGLFMPEGADRIRDVYMTRAQMLRIARAMTVPSNRALLMLAFYTGLRKGELWAAQLGPGYLLLPSNSTKTRRTRLVPVPERVRHLLRHLPPTVSYDGFSSAFRRAREKAGLPHIRMHDARHGAATEMVANGVPLYVVSKVLGHTNTQTSSRYAQMELETMLAAVERIGKRLGKF